MLSYPGCHNYIGTHAHGHQVMSVFSQSEVIIWYLASAFTTFTYKEYRFKISGI